MPNSGRKINTYLIKYHVQVNESSTNNVLVLYWKQDQKCWLRKWILPCLVYHSKSTQKQHVLHLYTIKKVSTFHYWMQFVTTWSSPI